MNKKNILLIVSAMILIISFFIASSVYKNKENERVSFLADKKSELFVRPHSPVYGEEGAKVYLTEFLDPECESCRAMYPQVKALLSEYKGKVKLVIRYIPLHRNSETAIKILEASREQGKYWETLESFFKHQSQWGDHHNPKPDLLWVYAQYEGLDMDRLKVDSETQKIRDIINQDKQDAREIGIRGTPTFFVNGKPVKGYGPQYIEQLIDSELAD